MKPPVFNVDWPDDVQALYRHDMEEIWDASIRPHLWNQYHNQLEIYLAFAAEEAMSILDIGCAQGTLALQLAERGHSVTAVDLRSQFLEYAKSRYTHGDIRFLQLNALQDDIPGKYDLIFANQIIEHIVYPVELCQRLAALLNPGGRLVVTTPNWHYLMNRLPSYRQLGDPRQWEHMQYTADGDGHFFAYSQQELGDALRSAGLASVATRTFETPAISGHMKIRYLHGRTPYRMLRAIDRLALAMPFIGTKFSHQLLSTGVRGEIDP